MPDFSVVVVPGALTSAVAVTLDMLSAAQVLAPHCAVAAPTWRVLSPRGGSVRLSMGLSVPSQALPRPNRRDTSVWVLPGLRLEDPQQAQHKLASADVQALAAAVARHVASGGRVAASCFSVFVLALAGVADGRRVTTTWWLAPLLQRLFSRCQVDAARMVCHDGPVSTAGAAMAHTDLMLALLQQYGGMALADAVSRALLLDARSAQSPYVVPQALAAGDAWLQQLTHYIGTHLSTGVGVADLAAHCAMSPRTLARRVQHATGQTPQSLIQALRLQRAQHLLQNSRMYVEEIAAAVGYTDATALRRLLKKSAAATPSQMRK